MRDTPPAELRREYRSADGLAEADLAPDWWTQFHRWFLDAVAAGLPEPNAMVVATADAQGRPSTRTVLLKGYDERGLVFYTNYGSRKGTEARVNPYASLLLPWYPIQRQVVICGTIGPVDRAETEAYFAARPRGSQLGAWASPQSEVLSDRAALDDRFRAAAQRFPDGVPVPAPPHWGGLRVVPATVEFWQGRASRLHDRLRYRLTGADDWIIERLAP
ncbi:pyridoxamine 5'-phosphate oxidase [Plantactinospora sp. KLBMP9567]|uniref:pyridoxamine 5'-phosphate oxidase n=1 Tax=Plantactinospora sp. KLBMP9567 TaxID=3085900 RepID=UPI002981E69E|nr:pyridoxamine 5'-phosphate oxidase [Plantactinospora sp. KLBMP9567]MDW5327601.1 pyridoxamine 5'-phosphate oxidase [Plantactinospora sp. KLBMP9567]